MDYRDYEPRWNPDFAVPEEVLAGRLRLGDLSRDDACWAVADLTARGYTSDVIADFLGCTRRHVKRIMAVVEAEAQAAIDPVPVLEAGDD